MLQDLIYVCVVSNYNLPDFESCLLRKPKHVVLVVSDYEPVRQGAERLQSQLELVLEGVVVHRPDKEKKFNGRSFSGCKTWVDDCLIPYLNGLENYPRACNITGGTKLNTLTLAVPKLNWSWLDYKDEDHSLQKLEFKHNELVCVATESLASASPIDVAKLSSNEVKEVEPNRLIAKQEALSVELAQELWDALSTPQSIQGKALLELFRNKKTGLEAAWLFGAFTPSTKAGMLSLSAKEFIDQDEFNSAQLAWLKQWHALANESIKAEPHSLLLPSKAMKDDFKRWLSGDWLEQLIGVWLLDKIKPKAITMNLKINPLKDEKSSTGERETDIVVHDKGRTTVIEVKTDLAPGHKVKDLLQQITSLGERLGRTRKVLMIGPQLQQKIQHQMHDVEKRCKADQVILCRNKEELLQIF